MSIKRRKLSRNSDRFYVGIDAGSVSLNCIVINHEREIVYEFPYVRHLGRVEERVLALISDVKDCTRVNLSSGVRLPERRWRPRDLGRGRRRSGNESRNWNGSCSARRRLWPKWRHFWCSKKKPRPFGGTRTTTRTGGTAGDPGAYRRGRYVWSTAVARV